MDSALVAPLPFPRPEDEPGEPPRVISAAGLFQGRREVVIDFEGRAYRLRITSQNKLILTK